MENIENLLQIYEQLRSCTNPDEVEALKKSLKGSIHTKERKKDIDRDLCKNSGSKELGIQKVGKIRMLSAADKSREVDNLVKEVKELAKIGKFGDDLTIEVHEEMQGKFPLRNLVGEKFESYMNNISDLLTKNRAWTIGVWGMGGVGKTTLIRHLHNMMLAQAHIYGSVYWVTVSKDCSIEKLQTDIAKEIGKPFLESFDEWRRASILAEALKMKKKFVIILDDMWSDFDLNEVGLGIPEKIGYRLIVTSRSKDVCLNMCGKNIIKVAPLSEKDALTLFVRSIGGEIPDYLTEISTHVLNECAGLPLGIIALAKSMIGCDDVREWRFVLEELRNSSVNVEGMEEKVFKVLRLSYERLKNSEIKECLLYCATYPEDCRIDINELIWLFIDARLLGKNGGMAKLFDKGLAILKKLERAALLSIEEEYVRLHDLIRDMTLQIAGSRFMIKAGIGLKGIPNEKCWTDQLEVVSLMDNEIEDISNSSPKCNGLTTLLLKSNVSLNMVCDGFFEHLDGLKLLDLSNCQISTLPKSISLLENLTALILSNCIILENLPSLAKLTSLEKLDLFRTNISQLPEDIGSLIKLRYFNLWSTRISSIGVGVINKLTALQCLEVVATIEAKELKSLNNLEHLTVQFEDYDNFSSFIEQINKKGRPNSYIFLLGNGGGKYMENLRYPLTTGLSDRKHYHRTNQWGRKCIYAHGDRMSLSNRYNQLLKVFGENKSQKLLQDIHSLDIRDDGKLMSLGDFVIDTVSNLQRQSGIGGPELFSNLKLLNFRHCRNLKKLFSLGLMSNFQNIEEIKIYESEEFEELIESAEETELEGIRHSQIISLPKLKWLHLYRLPNLERICSDDRVIQTPSLQLLVIKGCGKLKRMPIDLDNQDRVDMEYEKVEKEWVESLEWDPPQSKSRMRFVEMPWYNKNDKK